MERGSSATTRFTWCRSANSFRFEKLIAFAKPLTRDIGTFARGTQRNPLNVNGLRLGTFICYESVFPNEVREFARNGATVFVNISNDGWFGPTGAPRQHLNMARMRAVENNRWLLRDTNSGITAVIDPYGRVVAQAPRNQRTSLQGCLLVGREHHVLHPPRRLVPLSLCDNHLDRCGVALPRTCGKHAARAGLELEPNNPWSRNSNRNSPHSATRSTTFRSIFDAPKLRERLSRNRKANCRPDALVQPRKISAGHAREEAAGNFARNRL